MAASNRPLVTVGMTAFNSARTIAVAVASIIAQKFTDWEMIIVDDGSSDATAKIARSFVDPRIRLFVDGEHKGVPRRRNDVLDKSDSRYFAWMDSDDISYPARLQREVEFLDAHPDVDLVAAEMIVFRGDGELLGKRSMPSDHATIVRRPYSSFPMSQPTFMGKLQWFLKHRYNAAATRPDDQDLLLRSYRQSMFAGIQEILVGYREDRIDLKKSFRGRRDWIRSIVLDARQHSQLGKGASAVLVQLAKITAEFAAVTTKTNYRLLRHRAEAATDGEVREWSEVYEHVNRLADSATCGVTENCEPQESPRG